MSWRMHFPRVEGDAHAVDEAVEEAIIDAVMLICVLWKAGWPSK